MSQGQQLLTSLGIWVRTSDPKGRVEILIDQFVSVFSRDKSQDLPEVSTRVENDIPLLSIRKEGVFKLLQNIKVDKAAGPDELPNSLTRMCG